MPYLQHDGETLSLSNALGVGWNLRKLVAFGKRILLGVVMIRTIFVLSTVLLLSSPAAAATVELVKGKVLINRGDGFQPVTNGAQQTSATG